MLYFKWRGGFGVGADVSNPIPVLVLAFGYQGKPEPEPIPGQLGYYPPKLGWIQTGTHGYKFYYHV